MATLLKRFDNLVLKKRNRIMLYVIPQAFYLLWLFFCHGLYYVTCDDVVINSMAAGGWGEPTQYLCVESPILGYLTQLLFRICPDINWLGVIYIGLMIAGTVMIDIILAEKEGSFLGTCLMSVIAWNCCFLLWSYFTFTIVSYTCAISGMLWCMEAVKRKQYIPQMLPGMLLLTFGMLIRATSVYSLIIVIGFYAVYELLFKKNWRLILLSMLIVAEVNIVKQTDLMLNAQSHIQTEYRIWNSARSAVGDYLTPEQFAENGNFSDADVQAFYGAFLWDRELYSSEKLQEVKAVNMPELRKNNFFQFYLEFVNIWEDLTGWNNYYSFYFILFLIILLFEIFSRNGRLREILLVCAGALSTRFLFFVLGRMVYRVLMPGYLFAILCILCMSEKFWRKNRPVMVYLTAILVMDIFLLRAFYVSQTGTDWVYEKSNYKVLEYLSENKDKLFLPCTGIAYSLEMAKTVPEFKGKDYISNLIGNWNIYSDRYYKFLESYDICNPDRLVLDLPDSDVIRLVMTGGQELPDYIIEFIEERTSLKVSAELEESIVGTGYGDWNIYSIHTTADESGKRSAYD